MPISKYINMVAFELEGGYYNLQGCRGHKAITDGMVQHDGSVKFDEKHPKRFWDIAKKTRNGQSPRDYFIKGEVVSPPYNNLETAVEALKVYWPDRTNPTCGLHFHLSVNDDSYYSCLMTRAFYNYMKDSLDKLCNAEKFNRHFQDRFYNKTEWAKRYCRDDFRPLKQAFVRQKLYNDPERSRYTMLNFCHALHKTVEIRVFTTFGPVKHAVYSLRWWVNVVETFLAENYAKFLETKIVEEVEVDETDIAIVSGGPQVIDYASYADQYGLILEPAE